MNNKTILVGVLAFVLVGITALGVFLFSPPAGLRGAAYDKPYPPAPEIALTRDNGSTFRLSEMRGNAVLVFFGYTGCPDVCPTTMAELKTVMDKIGAQKAQNVKVLFVTVDPKRDTPQRVQEYANHFNKDFIGLSGTESQLAQTWNAYGIFRQVTDETSDTVYGIDHTARVTLIDQDGNLRSSYGTDTPVEDYVHDLNLLLK